MEGNSVRGEDSCSVDIPEDDGGGLAEQMEIRMKTPVDDKPPIGSTHCIFKLPKRFKRFKNKKVTWNRPEMVSIGPYHLYDSLRMDSRLNEMQEFKWACLQYFLNSSSERKLKPYIDDIRLLEKEARDCYSKDIKLSSDDFVQMMILDGCFVLEWLRFNYSVGKDQKNDVHRHPLSHKDRETLRKINGDLVLLENQIPLSILETLFKISKMKFGNTVTVLSCIGVEVFSAILGIQCSKHNYNRFHKLKCKHLLDMVRSIFIPPGFEALSCRREDYPLECRYRPLDTIPCISKLRSAGIKVCQKKKDSFMVVEFRNGVIEMPKIIMNDLMCSFLVNCVAFEQCHTLSSNHVSIYVLFLDYLVNTSSDIDYLCDRQVIENYIETDAVEFVNNLGKLLTTFECDFDGIFVLCKRVNDYYQNTVYRKITSFRAEYFDKPWLGLSAVVLLVLTLLQTIYTIYAYVHPPKGN